MAWVSLGCVWACGSDVRLVAWFALSVGCLHRGRTWSAIVGGIWGTWRGAQHGAIATRTDGAHDERPETPPTPIERRGRKMRSYPPPPVAKNSLANVGVRRNGRNTNMQKICLMVLVQYLGCRGLTMALGCATIYMGQRRTIC